MLFRSAGGTFVRWIDDGSGDLTVTKANGVYCGFIAFGSSESGDQLTALTNQNTHYRYAILNFGGNVIYTRTYERFTYQSRHGLTPPTPLVYTANQALYVSENGKMTTEDESDPAVQGIPVPVFPDGSPIVVRFVFFGVCAVPPSSATSDFIAVQTNFGV